jgi:lauroyl/myristoyl acyltransferase
MIKARTIAINLFLSLIDLVNQKKITQQVFSNIRIIGFNKSQALFKTYLYFLSKRTSSAMNNAILQNTEELESFLQKHVLFSNPDYWQKCVNHDGPVLFVTPHYGPFSLGCLKASLDLKGKKMVNSFYDPPEKNNSTASYKELLSALGYNFTPIFNDRRGLVSAIKALKDNQALTMMPDVFEFNNQTIYVPFFKHLTCAMTGTAFLSRKSAALIVHTYVRHHGLRNVIIDIEQPYKMAITDDADYDIYQQTSRTIASLEQQLKKTPQHWVYLPNLPTRLTSACLEHRCDIEAIIQSLTLSLNISQENKI